MKIAALSFVIALGACAGDIALEPCDIRTSSCQRDVFMAVQDVRGSLWDPWLEPPPMHVISEQQYRAQVIAQHEQAAENAGVDYLTSALKLLHMIDPNEAPDAATEFKVSSVAAYYDGLTHNVTIIDRGETADHRLGVQTLAHELVHAAQDRDVGFGRLYQNAFTLDHVNALSALLEGEATMYGLLIDAKQLDIPKTAINWRVLADWAVDLRNEVFMHPSPFRPANTELAYPLGGLYMSSAYVAGGPLEVRRVYDDVPLSAARFMAGRGKPGDVAAPAWPCGVTRAPLGMQLQLGDELGPLSVFAFGTNIFSIESQAWDRANAWTGDRFYVYASSERPEEIVLVWRMRFINAATAQSFETALSQAPWTGAIQRLVQGDALVLTVSSGALDTPYDDWTRCELL
ncbi:MAG TPA: hypothetical protein VFN67_06245 [Polyangiales bacterium]|nr:hypothetical protein [Polyangiales bacterium]